MDFDKYIELAEKMVVLAEKYAEANFEFEEYKNSFSDKEFKSMISQDCKKYAYICELEDRLEKAEGMF